VIFSITFAEHLQHVTFLLGILSKAKLVLNVSKCEIGLKQIVVFGHMVSATSITPFTDAIQAIFNLREPQTLKQANQIFGWTGLLPEICAPFRPSSCTYTQND
jgi:hypothetical protein